MVVQLNAHRTNQRFGLVSLKNDHYYLCEGSFVFVSILCTGEVNVVAYVHLFSFSGLVLVFKKKKKIIPLYI